ncbi:ADP-ribose pyrophosphatase [Oceanobacillus chungangensis]|uniref:ADP-ribose pyrophosphatase n=2 Tax=Oceanobacillus chungangensis TaxID=1229152 RepID=A0A3D8PZN4_9BACI|nr:ADP-ribose pyrophosphatase [Oceanobacillus chungangensis]
MVVNDEGHILLVKTRRGWEFPGGYIEEKEAIEQAAIREVKEESGIEIKLETFLAVEQDIERSVIVFIYKGRTINGELATSSETKEVGYFTFEKAVRLITIDHFKRRLIEGRGDRNLVPVSIIKMREG